MLTLLRLLFPITGNDIPDEGESAEKYIFLKTELEKLCPECRPKLDSILQENPNREYHESVFSLPFMQGAPNLKLLSTNAFDQLKRMPSSAVHVLPGVITGRRKQGRVR